MSTPSPLARGVQRITSSALGPYQSAVIRIGFSVTYLLFLLRELPHRHEMYGPDSPWSWGMAKQLISGNEAFSALLWSDSTVWFEIVYAVALLSAALLMLGWHTRAMSVLFMVGVLSLQNRSIFLGDGGDNVIHLMAIYLVLTRCGQVWSLDARRAARAAREAPPEGTGAGRPVRNVAGAVLWVVLGLVLVAGSGADGFGGTWWLPALFWVMWIGHGAWWAVNRYAPQGEPRTLLDVIANLVHNATLVVIMAEVCLIYATAGWYKIQGSRWQDGTALYYPLKLDYFTPWPALSDILASSGVMVMILTYGTVIVQVAFPFTLFNRRVKNVLLVAMMCEHAGIALLLGLPFFSMAMIAADSVFLPTVFLVWLGGRVTLGRQLLFSRADRVPEQRRGGEEEAPQHSGSGGHTLVG
ncbi:HTTM domain-containing protein [Streptomyces sp. NBC_01799]|uniref:HTTM domain-containing protein n=1 Tax=Streptomyces sp. NBC_01800 TaxID=2975945 RepID=UPI002DD8D556|nr:HTTM domain-containing protein [Streptomyces sp. NBC_01800]WSA69429.1 HTTM domain-containing protein [Streptomyces sp. NBC_01800]WSA77913.1 HTTM domain-containing protein [Streptomyces sp. NBC_01799]